LGTNIVGEMSTQAVPDSNDDSALKDSDRDQDEVDSTFKLRLERTRQELLETGLRNRLISTPFGQSRSTRVDVVDEKTDEVFRLLVDERRSMSFLAMKKRSAGNDAATLFEGVESRDDDQSDESRHSDTKLQTPYESTTLQSRLLKLSYDAKLFEEEQGVSILYLAAGFLEWYESDSSDAPRYAPLLLIPVDLARTGTAARFKVSYREEDPATNLSLQTKLDKEFDIKLPDVPDLEDLCPSEYFVSVESAIAGQSRWRVRTDKITLWFFSFAKYLMYRDLDSANWPEGAALSGNGIVLGLLRDGFDCHPPICDEAQNIDDVIPAAQAVHVTNADSSQALVIEEVRRGRNLVVQGPPGTGKSETITNVIGALVQEGKKVLFVAEKLAALEVVKSRLDRCSLGPLCLELHSHKANKSSLYNDLKRTLELGRPRVAHIDEQCAALDAARRRLNCHSAFMNTSLQPADVTPFQVLGKLSQLRASGVRSAPFILDEPTSWSRQDFTEYCRRLREFEAYICDLGSLEDHPWKGVALSVPLLPSDVERLFGSIKALGTATTEIQDLVTRLGALLNVRIPADLSLKFCATISDLGRKLSEAPELSPDGIAHAVWETKASEIQKLVVRGRRLQEAKGFVEGLVAPVAWTVDFANCRRNLAAHGRSWFRWLNSSYRTAVASLRGVMSVSLPSSHDERLKIVDSLIACRIDGKAVDDDQGGLGSNAFAQMWRGKESDFRGLERVVVWERDCCEAKLPPSFRQIVAKVKDRPALAEIATALRGHIQDALLRTDQIAAALRLRLTASFGVPDWQSVPLSSISAKCAAWIAGAEALPRWIGYQIRRNSLMEGELGTVIDCLERGDASAKTLLDQFSLVYFEQLLRGLFERHSELAQFDGQTYEGWISEFRQLDLQRIETAKKQVALTHFTGVPADSEMGEMAIVRREMEKKRKHKSIRNVLKEAGHAIQAIKPVFMMSPISIAQFLEPGVIQFDVLVMDEASQVTPADALGAMARCQQVVIVGDSKQLPPSRFFSKMLNDGDVTSEDDEFSAADMESVLGLCVAQGLPQRMLRWHYRSRHHSLIAVSNQEFYDNRLYVVPSPTTSDVGTGLRFRCIRDGVFDRGKTATNRVEAHAVAQAILDHIQQFPDKSLGVATFSVAQRDAVRDELELLLKSVDESSDLLRPGGESLFIKNLENVQGDERDVIFISVGYGRDSSGYMSMSFGPLSGEGGERRMNVLISRARERCEVFSSIRADDINTEGAKYRGSLVLKTFLRYAETGILDTHQLTGQEFDSEFEVQVAKAISRHGYKVDHQIGTAGFRVDLAVVDPERKGRYLMGIECDGATYHSSRSARDRDRSREQVLVDRGWRIHRIWSTDWFHRPDEQLKKVLAALEKVRSNEAEPLESLASSPSATTGDIEREQSESETVSTSSSVLYVEASFPIPVSTPIVDTALRTRMEILVRVVEIEGPVHREEIARRMLTLWGQSRLGPRIADAIEQTCRSAIDRGVIVDDGNGFLTQASTIGAVVVRDRSNVVSSTLRKPEFLPPAEVRQAVRQIVAREIGISPNEVAGALARSLGFSNSTAALRDAASREMDHLLEQRAIINRNGRLFIAV